jgi:hypothetical protein
MRGIWCGTGFQPVSRPIPTGKMPVPREGDHHFPHMSQRVLSICSRPFRGYNHAWPQAFGC